MRGLQPWRSYAIMREVDDLEQAKRLREQADTTSDIYVKKLWLRIAAEYEELAAMERVSSRLPVYSEMRRDAC